MKLNEDWDQVYRSATLGLQHRVEALELENTAIKQLNSRLLLKVEHQQVNMHLQTPQDQCIDIYPRSRYTAWGNSKTVVEHCGSYCNICGSHV